MLIKLDGTITSPIIDFEPVRHGRWIPSDKGDCTYTCSNCGFFRDAYLLDENKYCPHCGAKMDEEEDGGTVTYYANDKPVETIVIDERKEDETD